ncbi:hypothetical protein JTB14_028664 [Gonioctena quinquepunctata]|nr:hypothetical protein JTB14_028664 [Gonioctena quinquepunctata]
MKKVTKTKDMNESDDTSNESNRPEEIACPEKRKKKEQSESNIKKNIRSKKVINKTVIVEIGDTSNTSDQSEKEEYIFCFEKYANSTDEGWIRCNKYRKMGS